MPFRSPQRVRDDIGPYLAGKFAELNQHPLVAGAETCGFMAGLVLVKNQKTRARFEAQREIGMVCRAHCFRNGLVMRAVGDRMIIAPPLTMSHAQIDEMMALIKQCLDLTLNDARKNGWLD